MWPDALLHALPVAHGEESEPAITLALLAASVLASVLAGLWLARAAQASRYATLATAFAAGALLFLFFDLLKEAAGLGQGLVARPVLQLGLVASFAAGALAIPLASRSGIDSKRVAAAWAVGIATHGAGEGWIVGTEASNVEIAAPAQAASFLLHKIAEGFTIPLVAGAVVAGRAAWAYAVALAALALGAGVAGFALGPGLAPLALFAAGAGASAYAILRLGSRAPLDWRHAGAVALGVAFVYAAGVLHEI